MVDVRVLVLIQMLCICNTFGAIITPVDTTRLEGESCETPFVSGGKCMRVELCDPAFLHMLSHEQHQSECRQNPFHAVYCCQPFLDFCKNRPTQHIINGNEAKPGTFPYLARLGKKEDDGAISWGCGANIISTKFLLTAAHCKRSAEVAGIECDMFCKTNITVKNFISHPEYKRPSKYHDIALVELQQKISFDTRVIPICPYPITDDIPDTEDLTIAGWGGTEKFTASQRLMRGTLKTVSNKACEMDYKTLPYLRLDRGIIDGQYCARGALVDENNPKSGNVDACKGDSGGPLEVLQNNNVFLIGVTSTGVGCGSNAAGIYTRVGKYFDWINNTVTGS